MPNRALKVGEPALLSSLAPTFDVVASGGGIYVPKMADFVIREWTLTPYAGDQAPLHVHHRGDEAFYVLDGRLDVQDGETTHRLEVGGLHVVSAGSPHTFATVDDDPVRVLVVMTPEIDQLIQRLHAEDVQDMAALWAEHHSSLAS